MNKRVISFSLWGDNAKYTVGALRNADLARELYPEWICRFYCGRSVPENIVAQLQTRTNTEVVLTREKDDWKGLFWRFRAASEADVDVMISRDTDSRLSHREKAAVDAWLDGGKGFHIMRDHPLHSLGLNKAIVLGGMWGARRGAVPGIMDLADQFKKENRWQSDQDFLNTHVYPLIKDNCCVHDEFFERTRFPTPRAGAEFVGQVFNERDEPSQDAAQMLQRCIPSGDPDLPRVSIITSLYAGGKFIKGFLENIVQQTIFRSSELIIIDCNSLDGEAEIIRDYMTSYPNIIYRRLEHDPGIYGAWNCAIRMASGEYITNANVDDRRFPEHIEVHARHLKRFPDAALVYADGYYTSVANESCEESAARNQIWPLQRDFSRENMMTCLPGWCPMWRKSLHDAYGFFDESYQSSGDLEMWMRAVGKGARFMKIPGAYGIYYLNPTGKSTGGLYASARDIENRQIMRQYRHVYFTPRFVAGKLRFKLRSVQMATTQVFGRLFQGAKR